MDEKLAIAQLKDGNLAGLEFLVHRYQVVAVHTAYLIIGDHASAEDVAQTAFLRLINKIYLFNDQRDFRPWFLRSVVNDSIKEAKRQKRDISLDDPNESVLSWLMADASRPEESIEESDLRQTVRNALQQLPPEQRAVVVQRHFLEMSEAEMVKNLQRPASTIKWWLHIARNRLKTLLGKYRNK